MFLNKRFDIGAVANMTVPKTNNSTNIKYFI